MTNITELGDLCMVIAKSLILVISWGVISAAIVIAWCGVTGGGEGGWGLLRRDDMTAAGGGFVSSWQTVGQVVYASSLRSELHVLFSKYLCTGWHLDRLSICC